MNAVDTSFSTKGAKWNAARKPVPMSVHRALPVLVAGCLALGGCVSAPPPSGFDLKRAAIVRASTTPKVDLSDVSERSAGKGAGGGATAGAVTGSIICAAALYLYPACVALVAAAGAGVGATTGAVVGKAVLDSPEVLAERRKGLIDELASPARQALLAVQVQRRLRGNFKNDLRLTDEPQPRSLAGAAAEGASPAWQIEVGLVEVGAFGGVHSFGVRMAAHTTIRRPGQPAVLYDNTKEVESETELTESEWVANDGKALRSVLDGCLTQLAYNIAVDLVQPAANFRRDSGLPEPARNSASCGDNPNEWTASAESVAAAAAVPSSASQVTTAGGTTVLERRVAPGQEVRVNHHVRWDTNCNASTSPRVSLTAQPQHGRVETGDARETLGPATYGNVACAGTLMRGTLIRYIAPRDFKGVDTFDYTVRLSGAPPQRYAVRVIVE